jgi:hypothetical protein
VELDRNHHQICNVDPYLIQAVEAEIAWHKQHLTWTFSRVGRRSRRGGRMCAIERGGAEVWPRTPRARRD